MTDAQFWACLAIVMVLTAVALQIGIGEALSAVKQAFLGHWKG